MAATMRKASPSQRDSVRSWPTEVRGVRQNGVEQMIEVAVQIDSAGAGLPTLLRAAFARRSVHD